MQLTGKAEGKRTFRLEEWQMQLGWDSSPVSRIAQVPEWILQTQPLPQAPAANLKLLPPVRSQGPSRPEAFGARLLKTQRAAAATHPPTLLTFLGSYFVAPGLGFQTCSALEDAAKPPRISGVPLSMHRAQFPLQFDSHDRKPPSRAGGEGQPLFLWLACAAAPGVLEIEHC